MKKLTTAVLITAVTLGSISCKKDVVGSGPVITLTRPVQNFTGIDLRMNGYVYYTKDSITKLEITAKESIHGMLETSVVNNTLVIRYNNGKTYDADGSIRINVSAPNVNGFVLNSSGSIISMSDLQPATLFLRSNGSGDIALKGIVTNSIDAESNVSGRITAAAGTAQSELLKTDASGKIDLSGIDAKTVTAKSTGSGDIKIKVADHLDATINGSGSIYFSGMPILSSHISGSGHLIRF